MTLLFPRPMSDPKHRDKVPPVPSPAERASKTHVTVAHLKETQASSFFHSPFTIHHSSFSIQHSAFSINPHPAVVSPPISLSTIPVM
jgi:hypothetical protein